MKKLKEKINFKNAYFLTTAIVSIFILVTCFSYAIFTATKERKGVLNIMAGNLYPKIIINDTDTTSYEIEKGTSKTLTLVIENINGIESKYNIFYKDNLIEDVEIGYPSSMSELLTNQNFILNPYGNSGSSKEVKVVVNNFSETDVVVEFGLGISLVNNEVEEIEGYKKINKNLEQVKSSLAMDNEMIPVYYDESDEVWRKADSYNLGDSWYNYQNQKWANAVTTDNKIALDLSSRLNNATLVGNPTFNSGALVCDGVDDWVNVGLKNISLPKFTMAIKFLKEETLVNKSLFGNWSTAGIGIEVTGNQIINFCFYDKTTSAYVFYTVDIGIDMSTQDVLLVITYDEASLKIFANGNLVVTEEATLVYKPASVPFALCANPKSNGVDAYGGGFTIYEAAIYSKAVSDSYVASNMATTLNLTDKEDLLVYYDFGEKVEIANDTYIDMDMVNTMWTYIPRYSYTIGSMDGVNYYGKQGEYITTNPSNSLPGEIDIKFIEKEEKDTGSGKYIVSEGISNYKTPEAFTFGDLELEGFWIGKFETSSVDSVNKIIPNVNSINNLNISSCYENSKNMTSDGNIYGLDSEVVDTHLTKNSEWEAVTYLTQSKYGKFGNTNYTGVNKEVANNSSTVTGCFQGSGTNCTSDYINGKEASTTGTIYGVYDMNGSRDEYVMGNYNDILSTSGFSSLPSLNYYDKYTTVDSLLLTSGWYNDDYSEIGESAPWIVRGGYNGSNSGIFSLKATDGSANSNIGYRISLINK